MKSMITELWYGNVSPNQSGTTDEYKKLMREYVKLTEQYESMVSKEVLELIDQQKGVNMRMGSEVGKDAFMTGFCLGARLMIEVFEHERYD